MTLVINWLKVLQARTEVLTTNFSNLTDGIVSIELLEAHPSLIAFTQNHSTKTVFKTARTPTDNNLNSSPKHRFYSSTVFNCINQ
jgi:hypothetical protein